MATTMIWRGRRYIVGQRFPTQSNEEILPVPAKDTRDPAKIRSAEGFECRIVDVLLPVEEGWVDSPTLMRWLGTDLNLLLQAASKGFLDAAVTRGSELPLLRIKRPDDLRVLVAEHKKKIRVALLEKARSRRE